ncbi:hypothetical protein NHP190012_09850 [Helicobacter sp. NHP19-012]|uniref:Uncharacterized protein n=1 Tax=Helicobacter gastrofelis TaxID=2849642 RepID=A0ABM7SEX1_9HELI|nr:hypothetical protein NHP190012_09850 [Helicobacter sp. NHP19-012]GMB96840.1 hypothetical protein NHP22001_14290 [Helicobacter sp. NHP22-001]
MAKHPPMTPNKDAPKNAFFLPHLEKMEAGNDTAINAPVSVVVIGKVARVVRPKATAPLARC